MSKSEPQVVTTEVLTSALREIGLIPFLASDDHIAVVLPQGRVMRFIFQPNRPVQAVAEWPRALDPSHKAKALEACRQLNATTYLPKFFVGTGDGPVVVRVQHVFTWPVGATQAQVNAEIEQFARATMAALRTLDEQFPDPWAPGEKKQEGGSNE